MITSGFFNSVDGDRRYNAEQMSNMFEGLIGGGVFPNVGDKFAVSANTGMRVEVGSGRAVVDTKWVKSDASTTLTITSAHISLPRYTIVVLRHVKADRTVILTTKDGTPAATPTVPEVTRNATMYEICLAKILVPAAAVSIRAQDITDTRLDTSVCGYVAGLVQQVSTQTIYNQWADAYAEAIAQMQDDTEALEQQAVQVIADQQTSFMTWFDSLAANLRVDTYIQKYVCKTTPATLSRNVIYWTDLTPNAYEFNSQDVVNVHINGLLAVLGTDYTITNNGITLLQLASSSTADVDVEILKSRIGYNESVDNYVQTVVESATPLANFDAQLTVQGFDYQDTAYVAVTVLFDDDSHSCTVSGDNEWVTPIADYYSDQSGAKVRVYLLAAMTDDPDNPRTGIVTFDGNGTPTSAQTTIKGLYKTKALDNKWDTASAFTLIDSFYQDASVTPIENAVKNVIIPPQTRNSYFVLVAYCDGSEYISAKVLDEEMVLLNNNRCLESILPWKSPASEMSGNMVSGCGLITGTLYVGTSRTVVTKISFPQNATKIGYLLLKYTWL